LSQEVSGARMGEPGQVYSVHLPKVGEEE